MLHLYISSLLLIGAYQTIWFFISLYLKRNDVADIAWGGGFFLLVIYYLYQSPWSAQLVLLAIITFMWSVRLMAHIALRNKGKKEDFRYKKWRDEWGRWFYLRSYLQVYLLQGFLLTLIILPITSVAYSPQILLPLNFLGLFIWIIGFFFESVGDFQLYTFLQNKPKKDQILDTGLWQFTRHPNYFGEVAMWWGVYLIAGGSPVTILGPLTITYLLLFVSGIPMLERKWDKNKDYQAYKKRTNAFFPWFTKN